MRLTLRTMLAYMDGILEPEDTQDLAKKIEESQFASNLLHRTRDVIRRIRLAAPSLNERGPNLDPNTVGEYLDNVLADDRLPDFENVCLKSDMHLAEVASCHQILTLVLGEPADINPESRQRMYQLPQVLAAHQGSESRVELPPEVLGKAEFVSISVVTSPVAGELPHVRAMAPDYSRPPQRRQRWISIAVGLALLVAGGFLALLATGQFQADGPVARWLGLGPQEKVASTDSNATDKAADSAVAQPAGIDPTAHVSAIGVEPAPLPPEGPGAPGSPPAPLPLADSTAVAPAATTPAAEGAGLPLAVIPPVESTSQPVPVAPVVVPTAAPAPAPAGKLVSDTQPLLRFNAETRQWERIASKGLVPSNTPLLALPTFRPEILLNSGITVRLLGGTQVELEEERKDNPTQGLRVHYGRIIAIPPARPGSQMNLSVGKHSGTIGFAEAESGAAMEVIPSRTAGTDPAEVPSGLSVNLYAASGEIAWNRAGAAPIHMSKLTRLLLDGPDARPVSITQLPASLTSDSPSFLDDQASKLIEQAMQGEKPVVQTLLELADHPRRREVRWLAARSLVYLGQFDALVAALNSTEMKADWPDYVAELARSVALSPESAAAVRATLDRHYTADGPALYRMLWGYSDKELAEGEDARLVGCLEHANLAFRILGFWNLKTITGYGLGYRPEVVPSPRQPIDRWEERQKAKEIRWTSAEPIRIPTTGVPADPPM